MSLRIQVIGSIPSKKNAYKQTKTGRRFKDRDLTRTIQGIVAQIRLQTGNIQPFILPKIRVHFMCSTQRQDLDNMYTTLQDCMVEAGILKNDNLRHVRDFHVTAEINKGVDACVIEIDENNKTREAL